VYGNEVEKCGGSFDIGYNIQQYVRVHDNTVHNSPSGSPYNAGFILGNSTPLKCEVYDNMHIDDRPIPTPTSVTGVVVSGGSLTASTTYYYRVTALDELGETLASVETSATTTSTNKTINLTWSFVSSATSYKVYRSTTSGVYTSPSLLANPVGNLYTDDGAISIVSGTAPSSSTVAQAVMQHGFTAMRLLKIM
jgi:hypothetical protein